MKDTLMHIDFHGNPTDQKRIRAGFIGCGSHSFRNLCPTFQFAPVQLVATCDLNAEKARAFAARFGEDARSYTEYRAMLDEAKLDAVFICTGYDEYGRPLYPQIACACLAAGAHVWIEKPPAASCGDIDRMRDAAAAAGKTVMVGFKKMFFPANEKAKALLDSDAFGTPSLCMLQYPQYVPTEIELSRYAEGENVGGVVGFLDHLCHPVSLLIFLMGMPTTLYYERSAHGAGAAVFTYASGAVAQLALTHGSSPDGGMERTVFVSNEGCHITVENNTRVTLHRSVPKSYGASPDYYAGAPEETSATWEPEFSLGQLYNKGLFLLGYYGEVDEFARSILEKRPPVKAHLEHARQITRVFEAFAEGPGRVVQL
jgi:predicted dehydrogenase